MRVVFVFCSVESMMKSNLTSPYIRTTVTMDINVAGPHPPHILRDFMPILDKVRCWFL